MVLLEGMSRARPDRAEQRKATAAERAARPSKGPAQRLAELDSQFGQDLGAGRERARLHAQLGRPNRSYVIVTAEGVATMHAIDGVVILNRNGRDFPIVSISQLRRLGEQDGFDAKPFVAGYRTHLSKESQ